MNMLFEFFPLLLFLGALLLKDIYTAVVVLMVAMPIGWKPTAFYWAVGIAFLASTWIGEKPLAQRFFGLVEGLNVEKVSNSQWTRLNFVWVGFFAIAGILNIYVAYNYSEKTWGTFKVFGLMAFTFVFMVAQTLWIANIIGDDDEEASS
jgi:intracellular septation protein